MSLATVEIVRRLSYGTVSGDEHTKSSSDDLHTYNQGRSRPACEECLTALANAISCPERSGHIKRGAWAANSEAQFTSGSPWIKILTVKTKDICGELKVFLFLVSGIYLLGNTETVFKNTRSYRHWGTKTPPKNSKKKRIPYIHPNPS